MNITDYELVKEQLIKARNKLIENNRYPEWYEIDSACEHIFRATLEIEKVQDQIREDAETNDDSD